MFLDGVKLYIVRGTVHSKNKIKPTISYTNYGIHEKLFGWEFARIGVIIVWFFLVSVKE